MYFFKTHHGDVVSPLYRAIAAATKTRPADVLAIWLAYHEFASQQDERGSINGLIVGDIADYFGIDPNDARAIARELRRRRHIVDGRIANWGERQENPKSDSSAARTRAYRARQKNTANSNTGDGATVTVTRHGDVDSRSIESPPTPPRGEPALELVQHADFAELWALWPRGEGKKPAMAKYVAARKRGVPHAAVLAGAKRYVAGLRDRKFCKLLSGWLADERWADEPSGGGRADADTAARDVAAKAAIERVERLKEAA